LITLHPLLADSLVSNLLGNSVKYNHAGGTITIAVSTNTYEISNTSYLPPISQEQIFKRFNTSKLNGDSSNGLGLAIVKKICDTHNLSITYRSEDGRHTFTIIKELL
jgi:signal transduction histidine kinase